MITAQKEEKKVEYLELIYDLIFVYVIGRNNSLLHHLENGFISGSTFLSYTLFSLAVIQIWSFSTFYINMHGRNSLRDHISLLLNMYLLYYIGVSTRLHFESFPYQYHIAWTLILLNIGIQYAIELRNHRGKPVEEQSIRRMMIVLFGEAVLVLLCMPLYIRMGSVIAAVPILYGIVMTLVLSDESRADLIDFPHLTERAMLYVVFTFGEMIIAIAGYFDEDFSLNSAYFSAASFLIVVGLFLSYEILYDHIIDREKKTAGVRYFVIHIFLIFAMNSITASLEFMRNESVRLWPKILFLLAAFLLYFFCLFMLQSYARPELRICRRFVIPIFILTVVFVAGMLLLRENMRLNILLSVLYVFAVSWRFWLYSRQGEGSDRE